MVHSSMQYNYSDFVLYPRLKEENVVPLEVEAEPEIETKVELNPTWYETKKVVQAISKFFLGMSAAFGTATIYARFYFRARPAVVIATFNACAAITFTTALIGIAFLLKRTFWKDPAFCNEQIQKVLVEIQENKLSYLDIRKKYRQAGISAILGQLNKDQKKAVSAAFLASIRSQEGGLALPYYQLKAEYSQELQSLGVKEELILELINKDLDRLSYGEFIKNNFENGVLPTLDLYADLRSNLINKFIDEHSDKGSKFIAQRTTDWKTLGIHQAELEARCFALNLQKILESDFSVTKFHDFITKNDLKLLQSFNFADQSVLSGLKGRFLDYVKAKKQGLLELKQELKEEIGLLGVAEDELMRQILPHEMQIVSKNSSYEIYKSRNGFDSILYVSETQKEELKTAFLNDLRRSNKGIDLIQKEIERHEQPEYAAFQITLEIIKEQVLSPQANDEKRTYIDFRAQHGATAIKHLESSAKGSLKKRFLRLPYREMTGPKYVQDRNLLEVKEGEIKDAINEDLEKLSFFEFYKKHEITVFKILDFKQKESLKTKCLEELKSVGFNKLAKLNLPWDLLGLSKKYVIQEHLKNVEISTILTNKHEKHGLQDIIQSKKDFPEEEFTKKFFKEIAHKPMHQVLKEYLDLFEWGVVQHNSGIPSLKDRLIAEIHSVQTFEAVIDAYSVNMFKYQLISREEPYLVSLVLEYYQRNPESAYRPRQDQFLQIRKDWGLQPAALTSLSTQVKEHLKQAKSVCKQAIKEANNQYENQKTRLEQKQKAEWDFVQQPLNKLQQDKNQKWSKLNSLSKDKEKLKEPVNQFEKSIVDREREIQKLEKKVVELEQKFKNLTVDFSSLLVGGTPADKIIVLDKEVSKLKSTEGTYNEALKATKKIKDLASVKALLIEMNENDVQLQSLRSNFTEFKKQNPLNPSLQQHLSDADVAIEGARQEYAQSNCLYEQELERLNVLQKQKNVELKEQITSLEQEKIQKVSAAKQAFTKAKASINTNLIGGLELAKQALKSNR